MKRLILVGGGHAHLAVLHTLEKAKPTGIEIILATPFTHQIYSGMLPGWMAGYYTQTQCQINLQPLAKRALVHLELASIIGMDAERHCVYLSNGRNIEYDLLSLNIGSETDTSWLNMTGARFLPVKPLNNFIQAWPQVLSIAGKKPGYRLVVIGGGAAGVEIALAARYAFTHKEIDGKVNLVVSDSGLLQGQGNGVKRRIEHSLKEYGVTVHRSKAVGSTNGVLLSNGTNMTADCVIAATGARASCWLTLSKLKLDKKGYIAVDQYHRSLSHQSVFAAGDVCARQDLIMARSGVHAVHAGPVLASNLLATITEGKMTAYRPCRRSLYLLACRPGYAVASWGDFSVEGAWVWHWKNWIDRHFIRRFSE